MLARKEQTSRTVSTPQRRQAAFSGSTHRTRSGDLLDGNAIRRRARSIWSTAFLTAVAVTAFGLQPFQPIAVRLHGAFEARQFRLLIGGGTSVVVETGGDVRQGGLHLQHG